MLINIALTQIKRRIWLKLIKQWPNEIFVNRSAAIMFHGGDKFEVLEGNFLGLSDQLINLEFGVMGRKVNRANFK